MAPNRPSCALVAVVLTYIMATWMCSGVLGACTTPSQSGCTQLRVLRLAETPATHAGTPPKPKIPTASQVYNRALLADVMYSYTGHRVTTDWRTGRTVRSFVEHMAPSWRRIEYLSPDRVRGRVLVSDAHQEWQYYPSRKELRHYILASIPPSDEDVPASYQQLRKNYILAFMPTTQSVANRKAFVLSITRRERKTLARRMWIDADTGLELKREDYTENGMLSLTVAFSDIDYHVHLTAATFNLPGMRPDSSGVGLVEVRSGMEQPVKLSDAPQQLNGRAVVPGAIDGYKLINSAVSQSGAGKPVLHLRYYDGLVLISVFELERSQTRRPTRVPPTMRPYKVGVRTAHMSRRGSLSTLNWDTQTLNVTMMGEVSPRKLADLSQAFGR